MGAEELRETLRRLEQTREDWLVLMLIADPPRQRALALALESLDREIGRLRDLLGVGKGSGRSRPG